MSGRWRRGSRRTGMSGRWRRGSCSGMSGRWRRGSCSGMSGRWRRGSWRSGMSGRWRCRHLAGTWRRFRLRHAGRWRRRRPLWGGRTGRVWRGRRCDSRPRGLCRRSARMRFRTGRRRRIGGSRLARLSAPRWGQVREVGRSWRPSRGRCRGRRLRRRLSRPGMRAWRRGLPRRGGRGLRRRLPRSGMRARHRRRDLSLCRMPLRSACRSGGLYRRSRRLRRGRLCRLAGICLRGRAGDLRRRRQMREIGLHRGMSGRRGCGACRRGRGGGSTRWRGGCIGRRPASRRLGADSRLRDGCGRAHGDPRLHRLRRELYRRRCDLSRAGHDRRRHHRRGGDIRETLIDDLRWRRAARLRSRNLGDPVDHGNVDVGDVDVADVAAVARIARPVEFAGREREPADRRAGIARESDLGRRHEGDQRRGVDRLLDKAARHPAPAVIDAGPAAVMERREPPGLVVDPGPAPRLDPGPVTFAVGRPVVRHRRRIPDLAVLRHLCPLPVRIEFLEAGHCRRDVIGRGEAVLLVIVRPAPPGEIVGRGRLGRARRRVCAVQHQRVAGLDRGIDAAADEARGALGHDHARGLVRPTGVDFIDPGLQQPDAAALDIDFRRFALPQPAEVQIDPALRQRDLHSPSVQGGKAGLGIVVEADRGGADPELCARIGVGRKPAALGDREICVGRRPVAVARPIEGERALDDADPADTRGRRLLSIARRGNEQRREDQESVGQSAHWYRSRLLVAPTTGELWRLCDGRPVNSTDRCRFPQNAQGASGTRVFRGSGRVSRWPGEGPRCVRRSPRTPPRTSPASICRCWY